MKYITEKPEHPIERLMSDSMINIRTLSDTDTVIGTPVTTADGKTILPVSRVSMGFMTGGGEYSDMSANKKNKEGFPFAGGSGGGVTISPIGFLVSEGGSLKLMSLEGESGYEKILGLVPELVASLLKSGKKPS
ncbi:sporulation protein YtfJ [Clostridia bacterium]|nr:sporulation protein YtfJ [Clostridia bacterium]